MKRVFIDTETTGLYHNFNGIHQIAGVIEIDGKIVDTFNYNVRPKEGCVIEDEALKVCGVTREQIDAYPAMQDVYAEFTTLLSKYINKFDRSDKAFFVAYNSHFDWCFMADWFKDNGDKYFCSFFFSNHVDIMTLAGVFFQSIRSQMKYFNLMYVANTLKSLGLIDMELDDEKAHDALFDIIVSKVVFDAVTNLDNLKLINDNVGE
jgi:DNA polymerase-3 subunit epsilon